MQTDVYCNDKNEYQCSPFMNGNKKMPQWNQKTATSFKSFWQNKPICQSGNTKNQKEGKWYYIHSPHIWRFSSRHNEPIIIATSLFLLLLRKRTYSIKTRAKKFHVLVGMVLLLIVIATEPPVTLFVLGIVYVLSGPLGAGYRLLSRDKKAVEEQEHSI